MVCAQCGSDTQVINSRHQRRSNQVWRRRQCLSCHLVFTTEEQVDYSGLWRVASSKASLRPFSRDKLLLSLYKSCEHRKTALADASALADTVIKKLSDQVTDGVVQKQSIVQVSLVALRRFDSVASTHYLAFHT